LIFILDIFIILHLIYLLLFFYLYFLKYFLVFFFTFFFKKLFFILYPEYLSLYIQTIYIIILSSFFVICLAITILSYFSTTLKINLKS
jgi:hypothetical protein